MQLVDKLVFKDLIGPFINGLLMFMLLIFAAAYMFPATEMLVKGVPAQVVFRIVMYSLPSVVTQTFPMAMLLSGLMAFGRLSADREAVALFATGISFMRAARPVFVMGSLVSLTAFLWNDMVVPPASTAYHNIRNQALKNLRSTDKPISYAIFGKDDVTIEQFIYIQGGFDSRTRTLRRVSIIKYNTTDPGRAGQPEVVVYADRASVRDTKGLDWTYYDGYFTLYTPDPKTGQLNDFLPTSFRELKLLPQGASLGKNFDEVLVAEVKDNNQKSFRQLRAEIIADTRGGANRRANEVDLYGKIALPLASLIFGVVGAALGVNTRRGGGKTVGFGMAIFIVFLYWVFYHAMFVVGKNGGLPPILASFLADIVGAIVGIVLAVRASR
ncbi:MAG: LptF/LptG family permease [Chloroherpetonaceae bacterium]|nr:LptF/LptG family permease [Chthonomonadaceae bacterium]MDW8207357.1 LptF/LptG family permease [Chloroherpetonaceae bacterium]